MKNKVFRRFLRRKVSVAAAIILLTIILACIFGPMFITTDPLEQDILNAYQAPSSAHWFGTDNMGRDIFIRMLYGGRNSLSISFEGVILGTFIGVMLGVCAGYFGGLVDTLISRFFGYSACFPWSAAGNRRCCCIGQRHAEHCYRNFDLLDSYSSPYGTRRGAFSARQ